MAAELSTGILAMNAIEQTDRPFSLLVVGLEAEFTKKATGTITFKSSDGTAPGSSSQKIMYIRSKSPTPAVNPDSNLYSFNFLSVSIFHFLLKTKVFLILHFVHFFCVTYRNNKADTTNSVIKNPFTPIMWNTDLNVVE